MTTPLPTVEEDETHAYDILSRGGRVAADEMLALAKRLAGAKRLGLARRILKRTRADLKRDEYPEIYLEIYQKSVLYTYKDPDLPLEWRLDHALEILREVEALSTTECQESLGLAGAIYKRKWEVDGLRQNLGHALFFYLRGYSVGIQGDDAEDGRKDVIGYLQNHPQCRLWAEKDRGYCGINAAFVLDLLAQEEEAEAQRAGFRSIAADTRREGARLIREEITRSVPCLLEEPKNQWLANEWWFYATLGEACFGLGRLDPKRYDEALEWLVAKPAATGLVVPEWEYESTARQLARLARLQCDRSITEAQFEKTSAGRTLAKFLGHDDKAVRSTFHGKFGLALSGGGFRASLFHIGVLARLAELDILRHVEVLSCVSGGSIIGAHYYLELRKLLETKTDNEIGTKDYIEIVQSIEQHFLEGVQRNIRTRVLAEWTTNVRMILSGSYTRTLRVGELYERELFSKVQDGKDGKGPVEGPAWVPDWLARALGWKREKRFLNKLFINPKLADGTLQNDFNPRSHNWRRKNKVPSLILNATSLNTGHTWQFTASYMGEPPVPINRDIDCNYRLRRMYYKDAPEKYRNIRLGHAVAASACVPGLFAPLVLDGIYPDDDRLTEEHLISLGLVDGGACDNQGVGSLLEQDCTVLLVSDASGQMDAVNQPAGGPVGVLLRTTSVSQARVREAQYTDIAARRHSSLLRGLMFVHLRQDLLGEDIAWKDCPSSLKESEFESRLGRNDATSFGISVDVQRKLSAIRTDLDSFSDAEADALMTSAYRMTKKKLEDGCVKGFEEPATNKRWRFLGIESAMTPQSDDQKRKYLERLLGVGSGLAFKIWKLSRPLILLKWGLALAALAGIAWLFSSHWNESLLQLIPDAWASKLTFRNIAVTLLTALLFALIARVVNAVFGKKQGKDVLRLIRWRETLKEIVTGFGMSLAGFLVARLHLHVFDRLFLSYGSRDKFSDGGRRRV